MHDARYYHHPEIFNPNRFLQKIDNGLSEDDYNPLNVVFGFGRRYVPNYAPNIISRKLIENLICVSVCPGRFFAEQGLWLTMASILAAFDIKPSIDDAGRECMPQIAFTTGTGRYVYATMNYSKDYIHTK